MSEKCECADWCREGHTDEQMKARHHKDCPHTKPVLFYYEDAINAWIPVPPMTENLIEVSSQLENGEDMELQFKRIDMTDAEMAALPVE